MQKKILLFLIILLFTFPVIYALVSPNPNFNVLAFDLNGLIFVGGFAKITGVFCGMKGKLGNAVLQTWKGIQVIRTHVIPANPQSSAQTTNRTLLTGLVEMFKSVVVDFVQVYWNPFVTSHQTGWGNLIGWNQKIQAGSVIDYELVEITHGSLPPEDIIDPEYATATGVVLATWLNSGAEGSAPTDLAMLCVYDKSKFKWYFSEEEETRSSLTDSVTIPTGLAITDLTAYLFFFKMNAGATLVESISDSSAKETVATV